MPRFLLAATALIVTGAACATTVIAPARSVPKADTPLRCDLQITETRTGTELVARAHASRALKGSYALDIRQRGAGGSASIRQSGDFEAGPGEPAVLAETTLGGTRRSIEAELTLTSGKITRRCHSADL
ncbi:MAG: hypothetical protein JJU42_06450 [Rhodobacteraceae bacterium]|nr:hypothetical protein [Paracoccaceae bacterium]